MKKTTKGFTIVELVVVIAVIAILAAVLIPTFAKLIKKAQVSNDTQLVRNLNTALSLDIENEHKTMQEALECVEKAGYIVERINKTATDNEILWDSNNDLFCYLNDGKIEYIPTTTGTLKDTDDEDYWQIVEVVPQTSLQKYSYYYVGNESEIVLDGVGFDSGNTTCVKKVTYTNTSNISKNNVIRTNSAYTDLVVNAPLDSIEHYDKVGKVIIQAIKDASYHENGSVAFMEINKGHVVVEAQGEVELMYDNPGTYSGDTFTANTTISVKVTNKGAVDHAHSSSKAAADSANVVNTDLVFDWNGNTDQNATNDVFHHVADQSAVTGTGVKTEADYNVTQAANELVVENRTEETANSTEYQANYVCMNVTTGIGYSTEDKTYANSETAFTAAIKNASANDKIILLNDVTITSAIEFNKNLTLNFNGKTITDKVHANRAFKVYNSTLKIEGANGKMVIDSSIKDSYGLIELRALNGSTTGDEKLYINDLNMEGITCNAGLLTYRDDYQEMYLTNCNVKMTKPAGATKGGYGDNAAVVWSGSNGYYLTLEVVGGTYEFDTADSIRNMFNVRYSEVLLKDVTLATTTLPMEGAGNINDAFKYDNCKVYNPTGNTWLSTAISTSNNGLVTVNGGEYQADYCIEVMNSAGSIIVNNGTFEGKSYLVYAWGDSEGDYPLTKVILNDGTYKGKIVAEGYSNSSSYIYINGGNYSNCAFETKNQYSYIIITGGTFDCDPSEYVSLPYKAEKDSTTGLWNVVPTECYKVEYTVSGKTLFTSQAQAAEYMSTNLSNCYVDGGLCGFYTTQEQIAANKLANGTNICLTDTTTYYRNGQPTTAQEMFVELSTVEGWGNYGITNGYLFKIDNVITTMYFATEQEANTYAQEHIGATVSHINY